MQRTQKTFKLSLSLAAVLAMLFFSGCDIFAPPEHKISNNTTIPVKPPDRPENVINNLIYAMTNRDIDVYEDCLDPDYMYHSPPIYPDDPNSFLDQTKEEDVTTVRRIFGKDPTYDKPGFRVIEFTFYHGKPTIEPRNSEHPDEDWVVYEGTVDMYLYTDESKQEGYHVNQTMIYKLRQDSEGNWAIIRWEDIIPR